MGLFKKRVPKEDDLLLHKVEISAYYSTKQKKFVKYDVMHIEGEINNLAGLLKRIAEEEGSFKRLIEKVYLALFNKEKEAPTKKSSKSASKSVSEMSGDEIKEMIRKNNKDAQGD